MQVHRVYIENTGETFACREGMDVLREMEQLRRRGIPVGCRNGGCGVCKVRVLEGRYETRKMSRAVISEDEESRGCALACKVLPRSDLRVDVVGRMARAVVARKGASFTLDFTAAAQVVQPIVPTDKET